MIKDKIVPKLSDRIIPSLRNVYWYCFRRNISYCLCFHDVSDSTGSFAITPEQFKSIIIPIKDMIVGIDDLKTTKQKCPIALTFDDGYESMISTVSPILSAERIPFTCYVTTDYLNREGYLNDEQLMVLAKNKYCTIGSHMCSHSKTRQMTTGEVREEWLKSKEILESLTGKKIRHAALPYGSYQSCSEESKRIALSSGYDTIANTIATPFSKTNSEIYRYVYQKNNDRVQRLLKDICK